MNPNISEAVVQQFCSLYLENWSIRKLERRFKIARSTIHYHLVKRLGKGCDRNPKFGLIPIIREHLSGLSPKQRAEVRCWLRQHHQEILSSDRNHPTRLLTSSSERQQSYQECWSGRDFRFVADEIYWRGGDAA